MRGKKWRVEEDGAGGINIQDKLRWLGEISYEGLLLTLCSLKYRPQALHTGSPLAFLRHSVVVVVWQLAHDVPARLAADCTTTQDTSRDCVITQSTWVYSDKSNTKDPGLPFLKLSTMEMQVKIDLCADIREL